MIDADEIRDTAWQAIRDALHTALHSCCPWSAGECLALRECGDNARIAVDALAGIGMLLTIELPMPEPDNTEETA